MILESILVTFEVPGLRFGGPGVPRGDFGAQGCPRDEKYSKSDLADPPPGTKLDPKIHTFLIFSLTFEGSRIYAEKHRNNCQKVLQRLPQEVPKWSQNPPKIIENRTLLPNGTPGLQNGAPGPQKSPKYSPRSPK